jgi:hypothetical protein
MARYIQFFAVIIVVGIVEIGVGALPNNSSHRRVTLADFFEVKVIIQGNETRHEQLFFSSLQQPDRIAASFCYWHKCLDHNSKQIENLVTKIQTAGKNPETGTKSPSRNLWMTNESDSRFPVFFHHTEGLTDLHVFDLPILNVTRTEHESLVKEHVQNFCTAHRCSPRAGQTIMCLPSFIPTAAMFFLATRNMHTAITTPFILEPRLAARCQTTKLWTSKPQSCGSPSTHLAHAPNA